MDHCVGKTAIEFWYGFIPEILDRDIHLEVFETTLTQQLARAVGDPVEGIGSRDSMDSSQA
jgi:hypothetical protein